MLRTLRRSICVFVLLAGVTTLWASRPTVTGIPILTEVRAPVAVVHSGDGSGRLFIVQLGGLIKVYQDGEILGPPFLDIRNQVVREDEGGLLGLAFHPRFAENGRFFVNYTFLDGAQPKTRVAEYKVSLEDPNRASPTERTVLDFDQPTLIHNAGDLAFGPDGYLYIASGDGGPVADPEGNAQNLGLLLGKILRIDVDGEAPYEIPPDNPFVGQEGARGEIWAYGLHNPFRMSFDRIGGRLFAGDVGEAHVEEVDLIVKGGNYGWNRLEGSQCFPPRTSSCSREGVIEPIFEYGREDGGSVIGGVVYRGRKHTSLWGSYLFGDFVSGRIWALREGPGGVWQDLPLGHLKFRLTSFGEDEDGELLGVDLVRGEICRLEFGWEGVLAQIGGGVSPLGSFSSLIILSNPGGEAVTGELEFFDEAGNPLALTVGETKASSFLFEIEPKSSLSWTVAGEEPLTAGWGRVSAEREISSSVIYSLVSPMGEVVNQVGSSGSQIGREFVGLVGRNDKLATDSALALVNPSPRDSVEVQVSFRKKADQNSPASLQPQLGLLELTLAPGRQHSLYLSTIPSAFRLETETVLRVVSDRPVATTLLLTLRQLPSASLELSGKP